MSLASGDKGHETQVGQRKHRHRGLRELSVRREEEWKSKAAGVGDETREAARSLFLEGPVGVAKESGLCFLIDISHPSPTPTQSAK